MPPSCLASIHFLHRVTKVGGILRHRYFAANSGKTMLPNSSSISAYGRGVTFGLSAT
jgi:hypothetical protein